VAAVYHPAIAKKIDLNRGERCLPFGGARSDFMSWSNQQRVDNALFPNCAVDEADFAPKP
jgi:hypothetical protein